MAYATATMEADVRAHLGPDLPADIDDTIAQDILRTIRSLWPYVWKKEEWPITPDSQLTSWYELPQDFVDLILCSQVKANDKDLGIYGSRKSMRPISISHNLPTDLVSTGIGIRFPNGMWTQDNDVYVVYRAKILGTINGPNYSELDAGDLTECIAYGAAARIAQAQTHERVNSNDTKMWDQSIDPKDRIESWKMLYQKYIEYRNNIHEELMITAKPARMRY